MITPELALERLELALARAKAAGADGADAIIVGASSVSASIRLGALEDLGRSEGVDLGLRVFAGDGQAIVSTSDISPQAIDRAAQTAVTLARAAPHDPYAGLADASLLARAPWPDLDLLDASEPSADALMAMAREAEEHARAVTGVTNSEGGSASYARSVTALATSTGFRGAYEASSASLSASVIAGEGLGMQRDYAWHSTHHLADLDTPEAIGSEAGKRAVERLDPLKLESERLPVLFSPRVSNSLLGHLSGAISGQSIARRSSFLLDALNTLVFAPGVRISDDPLRQRGLRSRPFDAEGLAMRPLDIIADGVLTTWIMECASARQLGLQPTGRAGRSVSSPPGAGPTNLYLHAGTRTPDAMIASLSRGLLVTDLIGMGVNGITGDYSRGAAGFLIENGQITRPVAEITIAGRLQDMFRTLEPASDLTFRYGANAPTVLIDGMTIAGA